ncbi:MAG: class I SAM-dependent methyltransferase, partial [Nocardioides sp.]|nr:class I SAM-dependent methyltransferase [Nocardioides sp.]
PPVSGMGERVTRKHATGWISVPADTPSTPVSLHIGKVKLSQTHPTPGSPMTGMRVAAETDDPTSVRKQATRKRSSSPVGPPPDGKRHSRQEIRAFSIQIEGIWDYVRRRTPISVHCGGRPLPIAGHGMFLTPAINGRNTPQDLRQRLDEGFVLTQLGEFRLSKLHDTEWQERVIALYERTRQVVKDKFGYDVFVTYGTLLGLVREGGYIGHDCDFDAAYVSNFRTGPEAAAELVEISLALLEAGFPVDLRQRVLHVHDPEDPEQNIDLFHTFFDEEDQLRFPWGVAGTSKLTRAEMSGTHEGHLPGGAVLVPNNEEAFVAHLYGDDWRLPKPGFRWALERTDVADDAVLTIEQRSHVYWAGFYARHGYAKGSSFFEYVASRPEVPSTVIDLGCGEGRDSWAFAAAGRTVIGLDQSEVGIARAAGRASDEGLGDRATFQACDVADREALDATLAGVIAGSTGPVLFYLRFFLHAIRPDVQDGLMEAICRHSRPGDMFAAEFRTDKDEDKAKTHGNHYRRFQPAAEFRESLIDRWGFEVLDEIEDTGLSPYGDEDPALYRVLGRRI